MSTVMIILLVAAMAATAYVLVRGVIAMASGKDVTGEQQQAWMRKRVLFQAVAIVIVMVMVLSVGDLPGEGEQPDVGALMGALWPWIVLLIFTVLAAILLLPLDIELLAGMFAYGALIAFALAHLSVCVLRFKEPGRRRA